MWEACELCSQHRCFWRAWNQIPQRNVIQSNYGPFRKSSQEPFDNVAKKLTCVQRKRSWEKARLTMAATKHFFRDRKTMMLAKMFSLPLTDACWASQNDFLSSIVQTQISREMLLKELFILLLLLLRAPLWKKIFFHSKDFVQLHNGDLRCNETQFFISPSGRIPARHYQWMGKNRAR